MNATALSLIVLTLNVSGPRRVHHDWTTRRDAIIKGLQAQRPDIAAFQEIWHPEDTKALAAAAGHAYRAESPALGVVVTSRFPIDSWSEQDLGAHAAVLRATVHSAQGPFDVYSARLSPGPMKMRRLGQMFRLAEFVRTESSSRPFLLLGDLAEGTDERESSLLLDLLEARDLCVSHGDEICGRTLADQRVDYALIPYSAYEPQERARTTFTELPNGDDDGETSPSHFGLRTALDRGFFKLRPAATPVGRAEALGSIADSIEIARLDAIARSRSGGWIPFLGTWESVSAQTDVSTLALLAEEVHSAQIRAAGRVPSNE